MAANILLFLHILVSLLFVGGVMVATITGIRLSKSGDLKEVTTLAKLNHMAEMRLIYPFAILTGVTGWLTAWRQGYGLTATGWLVVSYIVLAVGLALSTAVMYRSSRRLVTLVGEANQKGAITEGLAAALADRTPALVSNLLTGLLVFLLVLMVFRPF